MSQLFKTGIVVSNGNSTTIPLAADGYFIGSTDDVTSYEEIDISVAGGPDDAAGSLHFEFSPDGIHWDVSIWIGEQTNLFADLPPQYLRIVLPFFRIKYYNGSIPQTSFRLTTVYHRVGGARLTRYLNQTIDNTEGVQITRAIIDGYRPDGTYGNILASSANHLIVDGYLTDGISTVGITDVLGDKALKVDVIKTVASGGVGSGGTSSNFGDPDPTAGTAAGYSDGYRMREAMVYDLDQSAGMEYVIGNNLRTYGPSGSVEVGTNIMPLFTNTNIPYIKTEYDLSDPTVNYIGTAASGTATSSAAWTIKKISFDGSGNPTEILWSSNTAVWDDRATIVVYS